MRIPDPRNLHACPQCTSCALGGWPRSTWGQPWRRKRKDGQRICWPLLSVLLHCASKQWFVWSSCNRSHNRGWSVRFADEGMHISYYERGCRSVDRSINLLYLRVTINVISVTSDNFWYFLVRTVINPKISMKISRSSNAILLGSPFPCCSAPLPAPPTHPVHNQH